MDVLDRKPQASPSRPPMRGGRWTLRIVEEGRPPHPALGFKLVLALAAVKLAVTLAVSDRYGFHRDELYYLACARHLALGYVDFPPLTPVLAHLEGLVFGTSLVGLRVLPALVGSLLIILAAGIARELGGGSGSQVLAAAATLLNPLVLGGTLLFQTVCFDMLFWLVAIYLFVLLLRTGDLRLWLAIGVCFGLGLETKYTIVALAVGLAAGLLLTPARRQLRTPWPWLGAAIALAILAPNLLWQAQHGWVSLDYLRTHHDRTGSRLDFILQSLLFLGAIGIPLAFLGAKEHFTQQRYRPLGWACAVTAALLFLSGGKAYYIGPLYPALLAAGSVRVVPLFAGLPRRRTAVAGVLALLALLMVPIALPILPARTMIDTGLINTRTDFVDMFGWREMTADVARIYDALPAPERQHTTIWAMNYGEAGAIDLYGPQYHLPSVISTHLTYYYWKPAHVDDRTVIVVGAPATFLEPLFGDIRRVAVLGNDYGVKNEEVGRSIFICREPKGSLDRLWSTLQTYD